MVDQFVLEQTLVVRFRAELAVQNDGRTRTLSSADHVESARGDRREGDVRRRPSSAISRQTNRACRGDYLSETGHVRLPQMPP